MNPEILRNAWIETTPRRLVIMTLVLALIFVAAHALGAAGEAPNGGPIAVYAAAGPLAYILLAFWGARNAAEGVLGEIRDKTWDFQRLSSLSPFEMTIGKLFGPTLYVWYGGALCIGAMLWAAHSAGPPEEVIEAFESLGQDMRDIRPFYDAGIIALSGVIAQAVALAVALLYARGGGRGGGAASVFAVLCALGAIWALTILSSVATFPTLASPPDPPVQWWGYRLVDPRPFLIASYVVFALWGIVAVWRLMRRELQVRSTPVAFLVFSLFIALYAAGFAPGLAEAPKSPAIAAALTAYVALHGVTIAAAFLEPKNLVELRRLMATWRSGGPFAALARAPAYAIGAALTVVAAGVVVAAWGAAPAAAKGVGGDEVAVTLSAAGFLVRDLALILLFAVTPTRRRGAFAAIVALGVLYGVGGVFAAALESKLLSALFFPTPQPIGLVFAWGQAAAALMLLRGRWMRHAASAPAPQALAEPVATSR